MGEIIFLLFTHCCSPFVPSWLTVDLSLPQGSAALGSPHHRVPACPAPPGVPGGAPRGQHQNMPALLSVSHAGGSLQRGQSHQAAAVQLAAARAALSAPPGGAAQWPTPDEQRFAAAGGSPQRPSTGGATVRMSFGGGVPAMPFYSQPYVRPAAVLSPPSHHHQEQEAAAAAAAYLAAVRVPPPLIPMAVAQPVAVPRTAVERPSATKRGCWRGPEKPLDLSSGVGPTPPPPPATPRLAPVTDAPLDLSVSRPDELTDNVDQLRLSEWSRTNTHGTPWPTGVPAPPPSPPPPAPPAYLPQTLEKLELMSGKLEAVAAAPAPPGGRLLSGLPPSDILYLRCNMCSATYGSQHSIKRHFNRAHGCEPQPHMVAVQSASATRTALARGVDVPPPAHADQLPPPPAGDVKPPAALSEAGEKKAEEKSVMKCLQCGEDFPTRDWGVFRRHVRAHDAPPDAAFKCTICSASFRDAHSRRQHMTRAHSVTSCTCRTCDIGFTHIGALTRHLRTAHHDSDGVDVEYRCLYCPKLFGAQQQLFDHTRRHECDDGARHADKAVSAGPAADLPHEAPDTTFNAKDAKVADATRQYSPKAADAYDVKVYDPKFYDQKKVKLVADPKMFDTVDFRPRVFDQVTVPARAEKAGLTAEDATGGRDSNESSGERKRKLGVGADDGLEKRAKFSRSTSAKSSRNARMLIDEIVETAVSEFNLRKDEAATAPAADSSQVVNVKTFMADMLRSFPSLHSKPDNIRDIIKSLISAESPPDASWAAASPAAASPAAAAASPAVSPRTSPRTSPLVMDVEPELDVVSTDASPQDVDDAAPSPTQEPRDASPSVPDVAPTDSGSSAPWQHKFAKRASTDDTRRQPSLLASPLSKAQKFGSVRYPPMFAAFHPLQELDASPPPPPTTEATPVVPTVVHKLHPASDDGERMPPVPTAAAAAAALPVVKETTGRFSSLFAEFHPTLCSDHACDGTTDSDGKHHHHKPGGGGHSSSPPGGAGGRDAAGTAPSRDSHRHHDPKRTVAVAPQRGRHCAPAAAGSAEAAAAATTPRETGTTATGSTTQ